MSFLRTNNRNWLKLYKGEIQVKQLEINIKELKTMKNSKQKGARGERELSSKLKECGFDTRRGQQYCGANGDADVVGLPNIHIECKRVQALNIYNAISQAKADAKENEIPTVFHRKDRCEWLVTMTFDDWMKIYKESEYSEVRENNV